MNMLNEYVIRATADKLIAAHQEVSRTNDWLFFVDELRVMPMKKKISLQLTKNL